MSLAESDPRRPLQVLMLEDNATDAELIDRELRRAGYDLQWRRVETSADFLAAITTAPDLIISDWNMPKMSGRELLEKVRGTPALHHLPFIMITGENASDMVRNAIAGGVTDFIVKPFTGALLEHRVKLALAHARPAPKIV